MTFLIVSSLKLSVIIIAALAAVVALGRRSAALRHWVLTGALMCAAALPLLSAIIPPWQVSVAGFPSPPDGWRAASGVSTTIILQEPPDPSRQSLGDQESTDGARHVTAATWLRGIWIAGAMLSVTALCVGVVRLKRFASTARRVDCGRSKRSIG